MGGNRLGACFVVGGRRAHIGRARAAAPRACFTRTAIRGHGRSCAFEAVMTMCIACIPKRLPLLTVKAPVVRKRRRDGCVSRQVRRTRCVFCKLLFV